jgi:predicted NBD/HSP70 family sugar kinase
LGANGANADEEATSTVLHLIRTSQARTRSELSRVGNLGRTVVSRCVRELIDVGLVLDGETTASNGGRAPRELCFNADAGVILVAEFGATAVSVGVTDLSGKMLATAASAWRIEAGPDESLDHVIEAMRSLQAKVARQRVWGVGVGLPGPVEFATGRPTSPPIMPGWDGYDVRARLSGAFDAPVWVDNDVNVMALGELRAGAAMVERDVVVLKIGTGIGAGLISEGHIQRGAQGGAGDVGHVPVIGAAFFDVVCRCGRTGCLEAVAGGAALVRDGSAAAADGRSPFLAQVAAARSIVVFDVIEGAAHGDSTCMTLMTTAARHIGDVLATIVNIYNPSLVVLGGTVTSAGDSFLATIRQQVYLRSSPLATRDLRVVRSTLGQLGAAIGTAHMVLDELFAAGCLAKGAPLWGVLT